MLLYLSAAGCRSFFPPVGRYPLFCTDVRSSRDPDLCFGFNDSDESRRKDEVRGQPRVLWDPARVVPAVVVRLVSNANVLGQNNTGFKQL